MLTLTSLSQHGEAQGEFMAEFVGHWDREGFLRQAWISTGMEAAGSTALTHITPTELSSESWGALWGDRAPMGSMGLQPCIAWGIHLELHRGQKLEEVL